MNELEQEQLSQKRLQEDLLLAARLQAELDQGWDIDANSNMASRLFETTTVMPIPQYSFTGDSTQPVASHIPLSQLKSPSDHLQHTTSFRPPDDRLISPEPLNLKTDPPLSAPQPITTLTKNLEGLHSSSFTNSSYQAARTPDATSLSENEESNSKKRKLDEKEFKRNVKRRLEIEKADMERVLISLKDGKDELCRAFANMQEIASTFDLKVSIPEVVIVGMQSDGKSSFIEALLGFQFNIVESNIGTRRPLIIQMLQNVDRKTPYCRFRREEIIPGDTDPFEDSPVAVEKLSKEIQRRTESLLGASKDRVGKKPIILRIEYENCVNLTLYDTPGFRLSGHNESLSADIEEMVLELIQPAHRIILCLEQSTVEWTNSISRPIVQRVDPGFKRTILVNTKFDNRVKELRDKESATQYLTGEGYSSQTKVFFVSLPLRRNLKSQDFQEAIKECQLSDLKALLKVECDDSHFSKIGFQKARACIEEVLHRAYTDSVHPIYHDLLRRLNDTDNNLQSITTELENLELSTQRAKILLFSGKFREIIEDLVHGSVVGDPELRGKTSTQELLESGAEQWPTAHHLRFHIPNESVRLYGGSSYQRLLLEFEYYALAAELPTITQGEIAAALGCSRNHNSPQYESAVSDIVQSKARDTLLPFVDILHQRIRYVMMHMCSVGMETVNGSKSTFIASDQVKFQNLAFLAEFRKLYAKFLDQALHEYKMVVLKDFDSLTCTIDWDLLAGIANLNDSYDYASTTKDDIIKRVESSMEAGKTFHMGGKMTREVSNDAHHWFNNAAARLYAGIRAFFIKFIRSKSNSMILSALCAQATLSRIHRLIDFRFAISSRLVEWFRELPDSALENMLQTGVVGLREKQAQLHQQKLKLIEATQLLEGFVKSTV